MSVQISLSGPVAHRVYQRDEHNAAHIPVTVRVSERAQGRIEARTSASAWRTIGYGQEDRETELTAVLESVPVGEHDIRVRVAAEGQAGEILAEAVVGPVYVGDLWVLAGQSNMYGCGRMLDPEKPQPGVSCFYMDRRWDVAADPLCWVLESPDPVHWSVPEGENVSPEKLREYARAERRDRVRGTGLGIPFGKTVLRHTGIPVGLLAVAHGGTSMSQWDAALAGEGGRSLYGSMLRTVRAAGGKVRGCLWYQGESDAFQSESGLYYDRMLSWVASLRRDLGDAQLPFIYAQLSVVTLWEDERAWNRVQHDQLRLEAALGHAEMVPTIDALLADTIHPDTDSLRAVGERMAWAALRLVYGMRPAQPGPRLSGTRWNEDRTELSLSFEGINGRLQAADRAFSFQVVCGSGPLPLSGGISEDGRLVILRLEQPAPPHSELWHGRGLNPVVNVKDERGIPLAVFGPVPV